MSTERDLRLLLCAYRGLLVRVLPETAACRDCGWPARGDGWGCCADCGGDLVRASTKRRLRTWKGEPEMKRRAPDADRP